MKKKLHTPEGVRDIYNVECGKKLALESRLKKVFHLYGYHDIQTPTIEYFDVFREEIGTTPANDLYKFFDKDGNKKKGLGGGNCQVSTTLYNAVLKISSLQVTERHEHSNKVPYIKNGKDAAVAYGSYDFKFKNNSGFDIKIKATATANNVTITLNKIY